MRFIVMHKVDDNMEAGGKPSQELIQKMGALIGRTLKAGIFQDGAGLHRSAARARVKFVGGKPVVERGPYAGGNELLASFAMISLPTGIERAIELATELGVAAGHREIEVGPVVEGWDLNGRERPADAPFRFLLFVKGDRELESGAKLPPAVRTLLDRWQRDGLLQSAASLAPTSQGARSRGDGKRRWTDGPFAESKELIAGYAILELPSIEDAKRFSDEYGEILGNHEIDIRVVA